MTKTKSNNPAETRKPSCKIAGKVLSENRSMLGAAKVRCNSAETMTLFDGTYRFENLLPGSYTVTASLKGFREQSKTVVLKENETVTLDFQLSEAAGSSKICGRVLDAGTKLPVASVTLTLVLPFANKYTVTGREAYYEFDRLAGDSYEIFAVPLEGYWEEKIAVSLGENEIKKVDIHLKPKVVVEPPWG